MKSSKVWGVASSKLLYKSGANSKLLDKNSVCQSSITVRFCNRVCTFFANTGCGHFENWDVLLCFEPLYFEYFLTNLTAFEKFANFWHLWQFLEFWIILTIHHNFNDLLLSDIRGPLYPSQPGLDKHKLKWVNFVIICSLKQNEHCPVFCLSTYIRVTHLEGTRTVPISLVSQICNRTVNKVQSRGIE